MPPVIDDAFCIRQWDWSETSQTITLFTRTLGVVKGIAKGSKRAKSAYSGGIELLTRGRSGIIIRRNSDLALITEWDLTHTYRALRESLAAHRAGLYMAELVQQFVRDHDPHAEIFDSLGAALEALSPAASAWPALLGFQWAVLVGCGYRPELQHDASSGQPLANAPTLSFDPRAGGLIGGAVPPAHADVWRVRLRTVERLRTLSASAEAESPATLTDPDPESTERAARLLGVYIRHVLGAQPATHDLIFGRSQRRD